MRHARKNKAELARRRASRHYQANREKKLVYQMAYHLRRTYGITQEQFDEMVAGRSGRCDLCHRVPDHKLRVDHDHETGEVRGLLCASCNSGLGFLGDTIEDLQRAINYLKGV